MSWTSAALQSERATAGTAYAAADRDGASELRSGVACIVLRQQVVRVTGHAARLTRDVMQGAPHDAHLQLRRRRDVALEDGRCSIRERNQEVLKRLPAMLVSHLLTQA